MTEIYRNGQYFKKNPLWHEEDSLWKARKIAYIIKKNGLSPRRICEVGCGAGEILNKLLKMFDGEVEFFGYEISPQAFDLCQKKRKPNLNFYLEDVLNNGSLYFDIAMAIDVLEHVEDFFGFLKKLKKKGEYKIFHIPLDISVQSVFRKGRIIEGRKKVGHIHYFTKETALETLRETGYEIIDYFYTGSSIELPKRGWKANILKIPRKIVFFINKDFAVRLLGGYSLMVLAE